ncbi:hypothetical protein AgCh_001735 [Apium graveolens]
MLLAYACYKKIKLHQMDVKSAFLNECLEEEVYVKQPPGFEHEQHLDYVYKLKKALYGLKQAPRDWYKRLSKFLIKNGFIRGKIDPTLFTRQNGDDILIVQIYVDDIIFGSTNDSMCEWFSKCIRSEFDMSMMGELNYFLGLQIKQSKDGIYVHQSKYVKNLLTRFGFDNVKPKSTPMNQNSKLTSDEKGKDVDIKKYRGCQTDRKSISGVCTYLGQSLVSWQSKKQTSGALSTTEGEYLAAGSCSSQILWMIQILRDFGIKCGKVPIYCDNTSTINISKNLVNHSRITHIDVRHHFLRDNVAKVIFLLTVFSPTSSQFDLIMVRATRKSGLLANHSVSKQDNTVVDLGNESADKVSQTPDSKKLKITLSFDSPDLEPRFTENALDSRPILPGIPVIVHEFYTNMHKDKFGNCVSTVRDKRIRLNPPFLSSLIKFENPTEIEVFTGNGYVVLPDFSIMDQFKLLLGSDSNVEENPQPPSTTLVTSMAHFLFKICRANVCPRDGNKSTFSCQDVTVVAMILAGRAFDLSHLILKNMLAAVNQKKIGLPYGLLLSKIFDSFKIDLKSAVKLSVKEVLDAKTIAMSNLHIENEQVNQLKNEIKGLKDIMLNFMSAAKPSASQSNADLETGLDDLVNAVGDMENEDQPDAYFSPKDYAVNTSDQPSI